MYLEDLLEHIALRLDEGAEHRSPSRYAGTAATPEHVEWVAGQRNFHLAPGARRTAGPGFLRKALTESTGGGSYIVPPEHAGFVWDRLASASVGLRSGFRVIETRRDELHIPRLTADAAADWVAEMDPITDSEPALDEVVARPRKLAALVQMSNEIRKDSTPGVLDVVEGNLVRALASKLDLGFYEGSGTAPEIRGLKNVVGIQSIILGGAGGNGAAFADLDPIADAISLLEQANATASAVVMHPRTWGDLSKLKEATGSAKPLLQESAGSGGQAIDRHVYGLPVFLSSALAIDETQGTADDASSVLVYDAPQVVAVRRQDISVELDTSRLFNLDASEVRAVSRWDLVAPNPEAVVRISGVVAA